MIGEGILARPVGDAMLMAQQLRNINKVGELPNVSIRMVPFSAGMHLGVDTGVFEILDFPRNPQLGSPPTTVFIDQLAGKLFLDSPKEIEPYQETWDDVLDHALDEVQSRDLIEQAARRFDQQ